MSIGSPISHLLMVTAISWDKNQMLDPSRSTDFGGTGLRKVHSIVGLGERAADRHIEQGLLEVLADSIYTYMTRGYYPMWYLKHESLVEYGLARFIGSNVAVEEPLALVSIVRYFESQHLTLSGNIRKRLQNDKGTAFEELVLLAITKLLRDGRRLKDVFQFHNQTPGWACCTARVVTRTSSGDFKDFDIVDGRQPLLPSHGVAVYAKGPDDVKRWLESGQAGWCLPGTLMGPDLMAWLRLSNGKALLLVIQAKCYFTGNKDTVSAEVTAKAIQSLIPRNFFASLVCRWLSPLSCS
jgi:hypothetical protein